MHRARIGFVGGQRDRQRLDDRLRAAVAILGVGALGAARRARAGATNSAFFMAISLPPNRREVQRTLCKRPLPFDQKPLDAAAMSKDKSAKIPTPQAVRGTQDMLGDFADRFRMSSTPSSACAASMATSASKCR
jgi:hypothetical protein